MKTDSQLQKDVLAELAWEPSVNAAHIGVEVREGIVTLAGHVCSYAEKLDAERAAQRVHGVRALAIEMDVKLTGLSKRTDSDIASSVENVLQWTTYLPNDRIKVMVEGGWVTLSGEVDRDYQRQTAVAAVRYLLGVTGVSDQIVIKPQVTSFAVKSDIEAALKRSATVDAEKISVAVDGADVTLSGKVHSWFERDLAKNTAWNTSGVKNVVDNMTFA
ncbi:MAG TPA: BON domain-containing protein [Xanthomonadaceae bacterium]|nr:BON domain-containing protein [Xanthomonadaceae bacterium]